MKIYFVLIFTMVLSGINVFAADNVLNVAISATPNSLAPFYSTDANSQNINRLTHTSLIDFNEKMEFVCISCESFVSRMDKKEQVIKFKLKKNITFTDGELLTAQHVVDSWQFFAKNELIKSTFIGAFENLKEIKVLASDELEIRYHHFSLENLSNLALLKILKLKNGPKAELEPSEIIGAGDYELVSSTPLEIKIKPRISHLPTIVFKVVKDETTLALKLINKEIDLSVANMSPRKIEWLKSKKEIKIWERASGNFQFIGLNHKREVFQDKRVRRAFSLLIPREKILKYKLKNTAVLSTGMFSPAFSEMYDEVEVDKFNPSEAASLLKEAGYSKNKNGFLEKNGKLLEIDWKVSNNKASIEIVEVLQSFYQDHGIKINISIQEWGTYMSAFKAGKFDIVVGQWIGFTGPDMLRFVFHSTNTPPKGGNRIGYKNVLVDKYIDLATIETDSQKRTTYYKTALKIINDDYANINLWHPNVIWIGRSCLNNIALEPNASFYPLKKVEKKCE